MSRSHGIPKGGGPGAVPMDGGEMIDASSSWETFGVTLMSLGWTRAAGWNTVWTGPWAGAHGDHLGLRLSAGDGVHYGWVRVGVDAGDGDLTVHGAAVHPEPGVGILAGEQR